MVSVLNLPLLHSGWDEPPPILSSPEKEEGTAEKAWKERQWRGQLRSQRKSSNKEREAGRGRAFSRRQWSQTVVWLPQLSRQSSALQV